MIVCFFSSFSTSQNTKDVYERLGCLVNSSNPSYFQDWDAYQKSDDPRKMYFTTPEEGKPYTHVVLLNGAMPRLDNIPKKKVLGLAFEPLPFLNLPPSFYEYASQHIGQYFIGDVYPSMPSCFHERFSYMWHCSVPSYNPISKERLMSIMVSNKNFAPGHQLRHQLVQTILQSGLPIDIYGNGCELYPGGDSRIKGKFVEQEPYEDYHFHIAIENYETAHYFSEKIMNPLLYQCTPIYWGCRNIHAYFPNSLYSLGSWEQIQQIIKDPWSYKKKIDVQQVHETINLSKHLYDIFSTDNVKEE